MNLIFRIGDGGEWRVCTGKIKICKGNLRFLFLFCFFFIISCEGVVACGKKGCL